MTETMRNWSLELDADRIAWLCIDCAGPSANTLAREVMPELEVHGRNAVNFILSMLCYTVAAVVLPAGTKR